jgi:hypothetical protein
MDREVGRERKRGRAEGTGKENEESGDARKER